jgi:intein-encoded DNA endonuclease-like protein
LSSKTASGIFTEPLFDAVCVTSPLVRLLPVDSEASAINHSNRENNVEKNTKKRVYMNKKVFALSMVGALALSLHLTSVRADESTTDRIKDAAGDQSTAAKKTVRKAKQSVRKEAGTDTAGKDVKDKANDAGDSISNEAKKDQRKLSN